MRELDMANNCIICSRADSLNTDSAIMTFCCERCGNYQIRKILKDKVISLNTNKKITLSKILRNSSLENRQYFQVNESFLSSLVPITPYEQANNLILHIGNATNNIGEYFLPFKDSSYRSLLCADIGMSFKDPLKNFQFICQSLAEKGLLISSKKDPSNTEYVFSSRDTCKILLTFDGWQKYHDLINAESESNFGFLAIPFSDKNNTSIPYNQLENALTKFKEIVLDKTGYLLKNPLQVNPQAGAINLRIASEIRKAKFVVADLTHGNNGAYWEAGFAQGLGKPVFYTCKKNEEAEVKTHFDVNQHTTIFWEVGKEEDAALNLVAAIENTLLDKNKFQ